MAKESVANYGKPVTFNSGDMIYQSDFLVGDPSVFLILDGEVEVIKKYTPLQKEIFRYKKGGLFGMLEVYTGTVRLTAARAATDVRAIGFSRVEFERAMVANLNFALSAIRELSRLLRQINSRLKELH